MAEADIYDFSELEPGNAVPGPAVIHTPITTIVLAGEADRPDGRLSQRRRSNSPTLRPAMDPITFSIIRHRLFRVVDEAVITLKHVSGSAITNEGHDLMVSLYRADGSLLMGGVGFLHHLTSAAEACKAIIRRFEGQINEGDVYLLNDPVHRGAAHLGHLSGIADPSRGTARRLERVLRPRLRHRRDEPRRLQPGLAGHLHRRLQLARH